MVESLASLMEDLLECERESNVEGLLCVLNSLLETTASKSHDEVSKFAAKRGEKLKKLKKTHEDATVRGKAAEVVEEWRRIARLHLAQMDSDIQKITPNKASKSEKKEAKPKLSCVVLTGRERTCPYCLNTYKSERGLNVHLDYAREAGCRQHGFDFDKTYGISRARAQRRELRQSRFGF
mmetsp:Transcript_34208/g.81543  ORF Transcript_34208/g.81543 Transcript_34208/m.81543 type:complete len:180 (+) Transcript_34208:76-615(+)